eukprot:s1054_g11.t1
MPEPFETTEHPESAPSGQAAPMAGATSVAVATGSGGAEGGFFRDREPPPSYDGENPETTFVTFEKNVRLWEFETDTPAAKRGVKLLRALSGTARLAVDEMAFEDIATERGVYNIMAKLKDYYQPHLEVSLPRAFEAAVYGPVRQSKEGFGEYIARCDKAFARLKKEGVDLPDGAQGYIIYRQSGLSEAQEQRFLVWAEGKYDRKVVVTALRKLDKVVKDKPKSHYWTGDSQSGPEEEQWEDPYELIAKEEDDNVIYLQEGDLDDVLEEADALAALASYQEVRRAVRDQQKGRGYYKGFGKGKGLGGFSDGKGKGRWKRVHQEQVKLRTRCWRCDQIGHMSKECKNEPKIRTGSAATVAGSTSSASTGKSGFLVMNDPTDEVAHKSHFWLRQFVQDRAKTTSSAVPEAYKGETASFHGITTMPEHGIVDTAAEGGLVGTVALERIETKLRSFGLRFKWTPKKSAAKGVGGNANVVGVIMLPLGIGGINGLLECTVIEGDVPLLLPVRMMRALHTVIDLEHLTFTMRIYGVTVGMTELRSGHVTVGIMEFERDQFRVPEGAHGHVQSDFEIGSHELSSENYARGTTAMLAQFDRDHNSEPQILNANSERSHAESSARASAPARMHHPKRARKAWRVILDKIFMLQDYTRLQDAVEEWFPQSQPLPVFSLAPKEETLQDIYAAIIQVEKALPVLKSKELPKVSPSSCVHPKSMLRGGGNKAGSYIVCKACHSRWANPHTSAGLRQQMKEQKKQKKGGLLSSKPTVPNSEETEDAEMEEEEFEENLSAESRLALMKEYVDQQKKREKEIEYRCREEANLRIVEHRSRMSEETAKLKKRLTEQQEGAAEMTQQMQAEIQELKKKLEKATAKGAKPKSVAKMSPTEEQTEMRQESEENRRTDQKEVEESKTIDRADHSRTSSSAAGGDFLQQQLSVEEKEEGGWMEATNEATRRSLRRMQQDSARGLRHQSIFVAEEYQAWHDGAWKECVGKIPLREENKVRIRGCFANHVKVQQFEAEKETHFSNKSRKRITRAFEEMSGNIQKAVVSEVFSPPRIVPLARGGGLKPGTSFDLETGWDLSDPVQRKNMWRRLKEEDPMFLLICPPCKAFSPLQNLNFENMSFPAAFQLIFAGVEHLELGAALFKWQVSRGKYALFEQPKPARSWQEPCLQELEELEGVQKLECDMCMYGMNVTGEGLNRKSTGLLCNSPEVSRRLSRRCDGSHRHVALMGGLAQRAQKYPEEFC